MKKEKDSGPNQQHRNSHNKYKNNNNSYRKLSSGNKIGNERREYDGYMKIKIATSTECKKACSGGNGGGGGGGGSWGKGKIMKGRDTERRFEN